MTSQSNRESRHFRNLFGRSIGRFDFGYFEREGSLTTRALTAICAILKTGENMGTGI